MKKIANAFLGFFGYKLREKNWYDGYSYYEFPNDYEQRVTKELREGFGGH